MLARLQAADAAFLAAVTIEARREAPASFLAPTTIRLTASSQGSALTVWRDPPRFQDPGTRPPAGVRPGYEITLSSEPGFVEPGSYDVEGNQRQFSRDRSEYLFLPEKSGSKETTIDYLLSPAGQVLKQEDLGATVRMYRPDAPDLLSYRTEFLWSIGRWYSPFLQEIVSVENLDGGLIKIIANGTGKGIPGRWELVVDTRLGDLVRSARFQRNNGNPFLEISNKGERTSADRNCAAEGEYVVVFNNNRLLIEFAVKTLDAKLDERFFESAVEAVTGPHGPGTQFHDHRQPLEIYQYTNGDGVTSQPRYPTNQVPAGLNVYPVLPDAEK